MGRSLADLVPPPALATGIVALGTTGWVLAGLYFLLLALLTRLAVSRSLRRARWAPALP